MLSRFLFKSKMANNGSKIKILSLNCNGLNNKLKRTSVLSWLTSNHKGLTFLQETQSSKVVESDWNKYTSDYHIWYSHGTNRAHGVCTMIPKQHSYKVVKQISDEHGRFLLLHTFIDNSEFVIVNLYAPTKDNPEEQKLFLNFVREHLCDFLSMKIIMGGNFNMYMNPELDKKKRRNMWKTIRMFGNITRPCWWTSSLWYLLAPKSW